jgi:hypothetical protein
MTMAILPPVLSFIRLFVPTFAAAVFIPTFAGRTFAFKLFRDVWSIPSTAELWRLLMKTLLGGDASEWDRAMQMPHYNSDSMPAISLEQVSHLMQVNPKP